MRDIDEKVLLTNLIWGTWLSKRRRSGGACCSSREPGWHNGRGVASPRALPAGTLPSHRRSPASAGRIRRAPGERCRGGILHDHWNSTELAAHILVPRRTTFQNHLKTADFHLKNVIEIVQLNS